MQDKLWLFEIHVLRPMVSLEILLTHKLLDSRTLRLAHFPGSVIHSTCGLSCRLRPALFHS